MKNNNRTPAYLKLFLISFIIISCESLIEVDLPNDQINSEDVYTDKISIEASLADIYNSTRSKSVYTTSASGATPLLSMYTDDLKALNANNEFFHNTITSDTPVIYNSFWSNTYVLIFAINSFLENLDQSTILAPIEKNTYMAEARFLRALQYHYLLQLFGDIPLITTTDYNKNTSIHKSKTSDVLTFVENELKLSLEALQDNYRNPARIYPNKSTVELVLAKNYLLQKNYALAELHAKNVLENPHYQIESDLNNVFKLDAKSTIWQFSLKSILNTSSDLIIAPEAQFYILTSIPTSTIMISDNLISSFDVNDKRKNNWISSISDNTNTFYYNHKYKNRTTNNDEYSIAFRIEEAYFTLMEALAYQDKIPQASVYLNTIRLRAGISTINSNLSKNTFIDLMLEESRKEFFTETMHRFLDLKRNNKLSILKLTKPNWEDKHQLLPIPDKEIIINPNLLPQNHDY